MCVVITKSLTCSNGYSHTSKCPSLQVWEILVVPFLYQDARTFLFSCYSWGRSIWWRRPGQWPWRKMKALWIRKRDNASLLCVSSWFPPSFLSCQVGGRPFGKVPLSESKHCLHDLNIQSGPSFRLSDCSSQEKAQQDESVEDVGDPSRWPLTSPTEGIWGHYSWLVASHFQQ